MYWTLSTSYLLSWRDSKKLTPDLTLHLTPILPPCLPSILPPILPLIYFFFQVLMYLIPSTSYLPLWRASGWHLMNIIQTFCFILFRGFIFQYIVSLWLVPSIWWLQQLLVSWLIPQWNLDIRKISTFFLASRFFK